MKIAIDGPAGAGKSTISKVAAERLGFLYIDTGAMYRALALYVQRRGGDTKSAESVISFLDEIDIDMKGTPPEIYLNGENVSGKIRTPQVSVGASDVAVIAQVRLKLVDLQRKIASSQNVVMDGRDIGTYVLPDAEVKIFLTADADDRARRRYLELIEKGENVDYETVLSDMKYRDKNDSEREFAPLRPARDSIIINTTGFELEKSIEVVLSEIISRM